MAASGPTPFCSKPENQFSTATVYSAGDIVCYSANGKTSKYIRLQNRGDAGHAPEDSAYPGLWSKYRDRYDDDKTYKCGESVKKGATIYVSNSKNGSKGTGDLIKFIDLKNKIADPIFNKLTCGPFAPKPLAVNVNAADFSDDSEISGNPVVTGNAVVGNPIKNAGLNSITDMSGNPMNTGVSTSEISLAGGYRKSRRTRGRKGKKSRRIRR